MNGSPPSSSARPGASPTKATAASLGPDPTTTRCLVSLSAHRTHASTRRVNSGSTSVNGDARDARADAAEDLPGDRGGPLRPLLRADGLGSLGSEQDDRVPDAHARAVAV